MSDGSSESFQPQRETDKPLVRLIYMALFWFFGSVSFSLAVFLGAVQFAFQLVGSKGRDAKNEELRRFSTSLAHYVLECLFFIVYARETKPFPFSPFPQPASTSGPVAHPEPQAP